MSKDIKSLATICKEILGISLSKELQCSDWSHRPLTEAQRTYAAMDAHCLLDIFNVFQGKVIKEENLIHNLSEPNSHVSNLGLKEILRKDEVCEKIARMKFGDASDIVRATACSDISQKLASEEGMILRCQPRRTLPMDESLLKIVNRYAEKLVLKESDKKPKFSKRKGKKRSSGGLTLKEKQLENSEDWQGPPPWDLSLGGNGCPKFLCDVMVEGLAKHLRCVGIDAAIPHSKKPEARELIGQAQKENRVLLTRDAKLLRHQYILKNQIYRVKSLLKNEQLLEQHYGPENISKDALCHKHLFAILCVFSGIYVVNYVLMNSAANAFYSSGLVLLTFQDAMTLVEQVLKGPIAPVAFLLVLFVSNQITALTWGVGGQVVLHDFLKLDIPGWLHCATIRIVAIIPALYCVWSSGAEGMYQLLIFTQVLVALLLPSSVIPLFRIASSRSIMGAYKIPQIVEFLALIAFIGMLGLKIVFVVEMVFGNSDWVGNLWNVGSSMSASYVVLLIIVCASFCLMLWLAATPLKSASVPLDGQAWNWDSPKAIPDSFTIKEDNDIMESSYLGEVHMWNQEPSPVVGEASDSQSDVTVANFDFELPETLMEPDQELQLTTVEESSSNKALHGSSTCHTEESASIVETVLVSTVVNEVSDVTLAKNGALKATKHPIEKTVGVESDLQAEKDDEEGDTWEAEDLSKGVPGTPSFSAEGTGSFRSLSGKSDDGGNSAGSLSRLAGLGRAARRQLAAILDEFWGQLYDFHGQLTQDAKAKRSDVLFGADSNAVASSLKVDTSAREIPGYFPSVGGRGSDSMTNSSLYDFPKQQRVQSNLESSYAVQRGTSSLWSNNMQMLDAYVQNSNRNILDPSERRYSSVRNIPSSESLGDYQPATVHGYQIASYVSRLAKERSAESLNGQLQSPALKSSALGATNYRDSLAYAMGQKLQNGLSTTQVSSIQSIIASRNSLMQTERPYYALCPSGPVEPVVTSANTKKYRSLPDIHRDMYASDKISQWDSAAGFGSSVGRTGYESYMYSNSSSRMGAPLAFDQLSPSKVYKEALSSPMSPSLDTGSLWSRQPFEQFGVADTASSVDSGVGSRMGTVNQEATSSADLEARLLQSFRNCIVKLLKLEGSEWLFRQNDGADEELIDRVAAREKFLYEAEAREMNWATQMGEPRYTSPERKYSSLKNSDVSFTHSMVSSVPHCGEGCVWKSDLIVSFGVWCIHRVLYLSLMESRPELWGKYTYVLNRLQGIIDLAFSKPRTPMTPCFCLHIPAAVLQRLCPPVSNGMLPPAAKPARGKCTTASMLLDLIKDVEAAVSCRKGRTGTAAGDVAFPKGKENLASVLKRYKRRLSNKPVSAPDGPGSRKVPTSAPYVP